jgi:arsenate reductase
MLKIYHNPKCAKSREGLKLLLEARCEFETVLYMENPPHSDGA